MNVGAWLLRHAAGVALAVCLMVTAGALSWAALPRGLYPELSFPRIVVVATAPDATAEIALLNVTRPLEEALAPLLGVRRVRSKTIRGAVEISLLFDADTDMVQALQLVQARLAEARGELPAGVSLVAERITPSSFPIYTINVEGALPPARLRDVALYEVRPALSRVAGVGPITVVAGEEREVEVEVDPARIEAAGLTVDEVARRISAANRAATVGRIDHAYRRYAIVLQGRALAPAELSDIVVGGTDRAPIRLADVARIGEGHSDPRLAVRGPAGSAAQVSVARRIGADLLSLDAALSRTVAELATKLPPGVHLTPVYRQAEIVGAATDAVRDAILLGSALAAIVMLLFLRDGRATLVGALAIPSSLLAACAAIRVTHGSLNLMSLGGMAIAVGLVIDDAVVMVEAIHRELGAGRPPREAAEVAVGRLIGPVLSSTITTVVVFAPLALLEGVVGAFFSALALALGAAVLSSLVIALTVIPLVAARVLRPAAATRGLHEERLGGAYARLLPRLLARRGAVALGALVVIAACAVLATRLGTGFIPEMDEGAYVLDYFTPVGTSLDEADHLAGELDEMLRKDPAVATFTRRLGAELGPPAATETSRGDIIVRLRPKDERRSVFQVMEDQRRICAARLPGMRVEFIQLLQDMLGDLEGNPEPIEIKIFGDDEVVLRQLARRIAEAIHDVPGLVDLFDGQVACSPQRVVRIDPVKAGRVGLSTEAVAEQLGASLLGGVATPLPEHDRLVPVRVRWPDAARFDPAALDRVKLRAPSGALVPLTELAHVDDGCAPAEWSRENLRMMVHVTARLEERDLGGAVADVEAKLRTIELPRGVAVEIGGQRLSQKESFRALGVALATALALVLLVLVFQFRGFGAPLAILCALPTALAGGVAALLATGTPLNVSSLLGAILLIGLAVKNGILLLHHATVREAEGLPLVEALAEAGAVRLQPILMTTLCTVAGLVPLALGLGAGAEMHRPLAIAVLGGLTLSTLGTLVIAPVAYALIRSATNRRSGPA